MYLHWDDVHIVAYGSPLRGRGVNIKHPVHLSVLDWEWGGVTCDFGTTQCCDISSNSFFFQFYNVVKLFCFQVPFRTSTISYSPTLGH